MAGGTIPLDHLLNNTQNDLEDYVHKQATLIQKAYDLAKDWLVRAANANKRHYDSRFEPPSLDVGSRVLIKRCAFTKRHKLEDSYHEGQYVVVDLNPMGDLIAVRFSLGGPVKWLNRKLFTLDPRGGNS